MYPPHQPVTDSRASGDGTLGLLKSRHASSSEEKFSHTFVAQSTNRIPPSSIVPRFRDPLRTPLVTRRNLSKPRSAGMDSTRGLFHKSPGSGVHKSCHNLQAVTDRQCLSPFLELFMMSPKPPCLLTAALCIDAARCCAAHCRFSYHNWRNEAAIDDADVELFFKFVA